MTGNVHKETFWFNRNTVYIHLADNYASVYMSKFMKL